MSSTTVPRASTIVQLSDLRQRVEIFGAAPRDGGYEAGTSVVPRSSGSRPLTWTHEAFEAFARLESAPTVLSILDLYVEQSGLRDRDDFSVSCLPGDNRTPKGHTRVTAVSVGWVEVLVITIDQTTAAVSEVSLWCEFDANVDVLASWPSVEVRESELDGGGLSLVCPGPDALTFIAEPDLAPLPTARVAGIRRRRRRARRADWHSRWLWALVDSGIAGPSLWGEAFQSIEDVSSPDAVRLVRQRTSQQRFRALLLANQPNECAICGLNVTDVLEAAHLIPHAKGGAASTENGRLLCANHHRAYDAGLYRWMGGEFAWVGTDAEPYLGGRYPSTEPTPM